MTAFCMANLAAMLMNRVWYAFTAIKCWHVICLGFILWLIEDKL